MTFRLFGPENKHFYMYYLLIFIKILWRNLYSYFTDEETNLRTVIHSLKVTEPVSIRAENQPRSSDTESWALLITLPYLLIPTTCVPGLFSTLSSRAMKDTWLLSKIKSFHTQKMKICYCQSYIGIAEDSNILWDELVLKKIVIK